MDANVERILLLYQVSYVLRDVVAFNRWSEVICIDQFKS
jgi:hypothetical protein